MNEADGAGEAGGKQACFFHKLRPIYGYVWRGEQAGRETPTR